MTQMTTCDLHNETIARLERELNEARAEVSGALEQIDRLIKKSGDEWERANRAEAKLAAKPDVAGLVKRLREGDHGFDRNGSHSEDRYVCLCEHLANEAADALLSLSAQLQEKEAECIKVRGLCDAIAADLTDCKAECEGLKAERDKLLVMASRMADCINRCQDDDDCSDLAAAYDFRQEYPR